MLSLVSCSISWCPRPQFTERMDVFVQDFATFPKLQHSSTSIKFCNPLDIWQVARHHCCQAACQFRSGIHEVFNSLSYDMMSQQSVNTGSGDYGSFHSISVQQTSWVKTCSSTVYQAMAEFSWPDLIQTETNRKYSFFAWPQYRLDNIFQVYSAKAHVYCCTRCFQFSDGLRTCRNYAIIPVFNSIIQEFCW